MPKFRHSLCGPEVLTDSDLGPRLGEMQGSRTRLQGRRYGPRMIPGSGALLWSRASQDTADSASTLAGIFVFTEPEGSDRGDSSRRCRGTWKPKPEGGLNAVLLPTSLGAFSLRAEQAGLQGWPQPRELGQEQELNNHRLPWSVLGGPTP